MKRVSLILFLFSYFSEMVPAQNAIKISQDILYAARTNKSTAEFEQRLTAFDWQILTHELNHDDRRKAFWINIYNAFTLIRLQDNPKAYEKRNKFFRKKQIRIAGKDLSLDLIEHGIIRRSKWKYSLGYFNNPFQSKFEKRFRVDELDYRIHFALNCGAKSCPPIAFYKPEQIDKQLDRAARSYLKNEIQYDNLNNSVEVPAILNWFRGDFGGKKGITRILKEQQLIPADSSPKIKWKKYDWNLDLENFTDQ